MTSKRALPDDNTASNDVLLGNESDVTCGWFNWRPKCLQVFSSAKWLVAFLCIANCAQSMVAGGLLSTVIGTLEKRFQLTSTQTGIISSSYDMGTVPALCVIAIIGRRTNRPRFIAAGLTLVAIATFMFSLGHFTTGRYVSTAASSVDENICVLNSTSTAGCGREELADFSGKGLSNYFYLFVLSYFLVGIGSSPIYTVGVTFMDDCLTKENASFCIAVFYATGVLGPVLAYILQAVIVEEVYVDADVLSAASLSVEKGSNAWLGAWWIGYIIAASLVAMMILPIGGLPQDMPGAVAIPGAVGGTVAGGIVIKRYRMTCKTILKTNFFLVFISLLFVPVFFLQCPNLEFAGITTGYHNGSDVGFTSACNTECGCSALQYNPICGSDLVTYYSPCHAGCLNWTTIGGAKTYTNCRCVAASPSVNATAVDNACTGLCPVAPLVGYLVILLILMLLVFAASVCGIMGTLRSIPSSERAVGISVQWILLRSFGFIPGGIAFGHFFDKTCLLWQTTCDESTTSACLFYDNWSLGVHMLIVCGVLKTTSLLFVTLAWKLYKPPLPPDLNYDNGQAVNEETDNTRL
ncbi:solute carrier organic anion transporter family member 4A1-like [Lingula anatina]|uniref:Solute carrier organic anion transporter family member 4A1-like n=1 Tax=Lingula anatina TaxID=7574 RepID=A0A1S3HLC6_LINAN|nr:solute carrier organic anion transporter family member 4A1-like [Lingula anatina]|eukprot:XP_013386910.1 solute carrier organic anion transporter family member 4A1-like [Lingula anatina]